MLLEQDDKLCKQDIKSFEQHIMSSEQVKKNKNRMSLPGFRKIQPSLFITSFITTAKIHYDDILVCTGWLYCSTYALFIIANSI